MMFNIFKKKFKGNHRLTQEDREKGARIRKEASERKQEIKRIEYETDKRMQELKLKRQELEVAKLEAEISEYDLDDQAPMQQITEAVAQDDSSDKMLMNILTPIIMNSMQKTNAPVVNNSMSTPHNSTAALVAFSDEQLKQYWKDVPKYVKAMAKTMSDEQIKNLIKGKLSNIDDDSLNRAVAIIRAV